MQVIFQTGAHSTEHERLLKCLLANREPFVQCGIAVPGPGRYRPLLKQTFEALDEADPSPDARELLLDEILDDDSADRVILLNTHFFGTQRDALSPDGFYPLAARRVAQMRRLFPYDQVEVFIAIRNPAMFLPAILAEASPERVEALAGSIDPFNLRWSELFHRIRAAAPDIPLTVWCNEDAPLIWAQILRDIAGLEPGAKVIGGFSLLSDIMSREGMARFRAYLHQHKHLNEMQRRRVIAAFLDKFALDEEVEEELDMPGWTAETVDALTEQYDEDLFEIQRIPGVTLITP